MLRLKKALTLAVCCSMLCFSNFASAQDGWGSWGSDQMELIEFLDAEEATLDVSSQPPQALDAPEQNSLNSLDNSGLSDYKTNRDASAPAVSFDSSASGQPATGLNLQAPSADPGAMGAMGAAASRMSGAILLEPSSSSSSLPE